LQVNDVLFEATALSDIANPDTVPCFRVAEARPHFVVDWIKVRTACCRINGVINWSNFEKKTATEMNKISYFKQIARQDSSKTIGMSIRK